MNPELIVTIIQYAIKFGVPAVLDLIAVIKKPSLTLAELEAAFQKARTPFETGLAAGALKPSPATPVP